MYCFLSRSLQGDRQPTNSCKWEVVVHVCGAFCWLTNNQLTAVKYQVFVHLLLICCSLSRSMPADQSTTNNCEITNVRAFLVLWRALCQPTNRTTNSCDITGVRASVGPCCAPCLLTKKQDIGGVRACLVLCGAFCRPTRQTNSFEIHMEQRKAMK